MELNLEGRSFVVGGASSGLGRAVAEQLVAEGASILLVARDADVLQEVANELGERAHPCPADVSHPSGVDKAAAVAVDRLGALDGVLVNAGGPPFGPALELTDEQWLDAFHLLIGGPVRLLRSVVPHMNEGASVLFITSTSVREPIAGLDSSNVLRPGVAALVKCLARELGPRIRVNSVAPGRIDTARSRSLDESRATDSGVTVEEQRRKVSEGIPLGRYGDPEELGRAAAFLLSPAASYITGVSLQVDGGLVSAIP
ncbi:MAG TPA: SDR family oxidoreductase [Rubrobacteraceae bacterium]|nr:SDR family oxidoreductase [Rubrobacteraceae bacterium]